MGITKKKKFCTLRLVRVSVFPWNYKPEIGQGMNVDCRHCAGVWIIAKGWWQHDLNAVLLLLVFVVVLVWPYWVMDMKKVNSRGIICVAAEPQGFNTHSIFKLMASLLQPLGKKDFHTPESQHQAANFHFQKLWDKCKPIRLIRLC